MPDLILINALATGDLIVQVDAVRSDYDPCKLGPSLLPVVTSRLGEARAAHAAAELTGGSAAQRLVLARQRLSELVRDGYEYLQAVPEEVAPASDVLQALETYGWERGKLGDIAGPSRIEILSRTAVQVTPHLPPYLQYPAHILTRMITWLGVQDAHKILASGGSYATIRHERNEKRELLLSAVSRVRHHYCTASDEREMNPELARIGLPPESNGTPAAPLPEAPGEVHFLPGTGQLTLAALPARAQVLVAWRQPSGGAAEVAGVSIETAVGGSNFSPLQPGTTYTFWVTGRNASGDGPASNPVNFTASIS